MQAKDIPHTKKLEILHFNDLENIEERMPRFVTAFESYDPARNKLRLFSGDLLFPSFLSCIHQGQQMVEPLNRLGPHVACLGNHEFDAGIEHAENVLR